MPTYNVSEPIAPPPARPGTGPDLRLLIHSAPPDLQSGYMAGVDEVVKDIVERCNPLMQPDVVLVGGAVTEANLTELARRAFKIWTVVNDEPLLKALDLRMDRHLTPHQRERIRYRAGNPGQLPLPDASADRVVVGWDELLWPHLITTALKEARRILRPSFIDRTFRRRCTGAVAISAPRPQPQHDRKAQVPGPETRLGERGTSIKDLQPIVTEAGFAFSDPEHPLRVVGTPPRVVLWFTPLES